MNRISKIWQSLEIALIYFFHLMGVFWYVSGLLGNTIDTLSGPFLIILGLYTVYRAYRSSNRNSKILVGSLIIGILGLVLETIGWKTGWPYGQFYYYDTLQPQIFGTPLAISFAWITLTLSSLSIVQNFFPRSKKKMKIWKYILCGLLVSLFDFVMEPGAVSLRYWYWEGGAIPLANYITWLVAGSLFSFIFDRFISRNNSEIVLSKVLIHVYLAQLLYFILIRSLY